MIFFVSHVVRFLCWRCLYGLLNPVKGLGLLWGIKRFFCLCGALLFCAFMALAFPCFLIGLLVFPLCGAALTFFAAAGKER
jgi:hypothetical protein